jgi:fluoride ion exporter CrcB/FEX
MATRHKFSNHRDRERGSILLTYEDMAKYIGAIKTCELVLYQGMLGTTNTFMTAQQERTFLEMQAAIAMLIGVFIYSIHPSYIMTFRS